MQFSAAFFLGALASAPPIHAGSVAFTSYFEDDKCFGTPQFIYEEGVDSCEVRDCAVVTIGDSAYFSKVDCYESNRVGTASIYADADAPYVLLEQYSPPTGCDNWVNGLAFYADGQCRVLPGIASYAAVIAVVKANSSLELQLFNDADCTEAVSDMSVTSTDVEYTCFIGYSDSYGLVYYTTVMDECDNTATSASSSR